MSTKTIIGVAAAVLIAAGGVVYFFTSSSDDSGTANSQSSQQEQDISQESSENFLGIDTAALEGNYQMDIVGTQSGEQFSATFQLDGSGNIKSEVTSAGQSVAYIYLDGVTYLQNPQDQSWVYYPAGSSDAPTFDVSDFAISNDDIDELSNDASIEDLGEQACSAGTCHVWRGKDSETGDIATVKVDTATNRLAEVEVNNEVDSETARITYTYPEGIVIEAPAGATKIEIPELQ